MRVNIKEFTSALAKVSAFASGEKNVPGVLLDIEENSVKVCYSDGRKSVIEKLEAITCEDDKLEKIVLNYQRLVDIIGACQPSGKIFTEELEFIFDEKNTLIIRVEKKIAEQESADSDVVYRTCSVFDQAINWVPAGNDLKVAILSRMNYDSIFKSENPDQWETAVFRSILDKTSTEKGRIVYVSPKNSSAFVSNMAYLSCIPIEDGYGHPMVFNTAVSKSIYDIVGKLSDYDKVTVHVIDRRYCCIHTEDNKVGIWVEMADATQMHITTLSRYQSKGYRNYQLTFIKEVLKNVVNSAMSADKSDKTVLKFGDSKLEEGSKELKIASSNAGASVSNDYSVICTECLDPTSNIDKLELPISLKVLSDMLNKCDGDYVAIDVDIDEANTKCLRVADVDLSARHEADVEARDRLSIGVDEATPVEEKLAYRTKTLGVKHYTISAK